MPPHSKLDPAEVERRLRAGDRTGDVARDMGVHSSAISYWRTTLGLPRTYCPRRFDHERVRELHARGLSDQDIAAAVGIARPRVGRIRRRMGLPAHGYRSVSFVTKQRAHGLRRKAELVAASGFRSLRSLDGERYRAKSRAFAASYGLPADLLRVQVAVVVALSSGPATATELADRLGRPPKRDPLAYRRFDAGGKKGAGRPTNYLTDLLRRGLIARVRRHPRESVYTLTPLAMDLLAAAPRTEAAHAP